MKNFAFILESHNYLRHYDIFVNFLKSNNKIFFLHSYKKKFDGGQKFKNLPFLFSTDFINNSKNYIFENDKELLKLISNLKINIVISLHFYSFYNFKKKSLQNIKWITLQTWGDNFFSIKNRNILNCDYFLIYSKIWLENYVRNKFKFNLTNNLRKKIIEIGNPNFLYKDLYSNKNDIFLKYGLNNRKKVLIYFPIGTPTLYNFNNIFQKIWLSEIFSLNPKYKFYSFLLKKILSILPIPLKFKIDEEMILNSINLFCKKNNYQFVVKGRYKQTYPIKINKYVYKIIYDESYNIPTIYELLSISSFSIGHYSMASLEALYFEIYSLNLNLPIKKDIFTNHLELFIKDWKQLLNFKSSSSEIAIERFINYFETGVSSKYEKFDKNILKILNKYFVNLTPRSFKKNIGLISK